MFSCITCRSEKIERYDLIEHYDCGCVGPITEFTDDTCPKCRKDIGQSGVGYRTIHDYFVCNDCDDKMPQPKLKLNCTYCKTIFSLEKALWNIIPERKIGLIYQ